MHFNIVFLAYENYMHFNILFSAHGFGINTNILETNVLNLIVVIGILVTFVGNAVIDFLDQRKQTLVNNLQAARQKAETMNQRKSSAQYNFLLAQHKAKQLLLDNLTAMDEEQNLCIEQTMQEARLLEQRNNDALSLQQKKAIEHIGTKIINLSMVQANQKLNHRTKHKQFQLWVNAKRFVHYGHVNKYLKYLV